MKVGDLVVRHSNDVTEEGARKPRLVVELIQKKCWRTQELGPNIDWRKIDPEPHAVIMMDGETMEVPLIDLRVINKKDTHA